MPSSGKECDGKNGRGYRQVDLRSLAFHRAVAAKLRENPALVEEALGTIDRWKRLGLARSSWVLLDKWRVMLCGPLEELLAKMEEDSDTMQQLRQASPFAGMLTNEERRAIIEQTRS